MADHGNAGDDPTTWCGDPECCDAPELPLLERTPEQLVDLIETLDREKAAAYVVNGAQAEALRDAVRRLDNLQLGVALGTALGSGRARLGSTPTIEVRNGEQVYLEFGVWVDGKALEGLNAFMQERSL